MSFILFDEIEKANDALWQLFSVFWIRLTLTLGDNRKVDLSRCVIFMTSNLGAFEMCEMLGGWYRIHSGVKHDAENLLQLWTRKCTGPHWMSRNGSSLRSS